MYANVILPELAELVHRKDLAGLREVLEEIPAPDLAEFLSAFTPEDRVFVFLALPRAQAADVFEYCPLEMQEDLIKGLAQDRLGPLLDEMDPDDRTELLQELPPEMTRRLVELLSPEERRIAQNLLGYPEESIGRLMTPSFLAVREDWTVDWVLRHIRKKGRSVETINVVYVLNDQGELIDDLRIRELLLAEPEQPIADLLDRVFVSLRATDDQESAVRAFQDYDRTALPVVDSRGRMVGIVTVDDVMDVAQEEATEDIQKLGGVEALDDAYLDTPLGRMVKNRVRWLVVLMVGEMLTASAMGWFEDEIQRAVVLALFVPLIISSGGNSGSQAATLVIRALALGEVTLGDWARIMRREILAGLALGAVLGVIGFLRIAAWSAFSDLYGPHWAMVGLAVAVSLAAVVLLGTLTGSMLPLLLKRMGADPAVSSAPFVATLVDVGGILFYFTIALVLLKGLIL